MKNADTNLARSGWIPIATTLMLLMFYYFPNDINAQPCGGVPQAGITVANPNPVCPGVFFTLMLVGASQQSGLTYQWYHSSDGTTYFPFVGAIQPQFATSELQPTFYTCRVRCTQSNQQAFSQPVLVTLIQPVITYPNATVVLNSGESTSPDNTGYVTFATVCCQGSVTYSDAISSNCCRIVITRTWTIIDCFGEGVQYIQTITVLLDVSAPVISCTPLGSGPCNTTPTPSATTVTVSDQCPGDLTVATSDAAGTRACEVVTTFTWTATDQCGHSATCTQTYSRIMDFQPPVITCPAPVSLPCNTTPTPSPTLITATDNCGTPEITLLSSSSSTSGCLVTYVFTWRAIDNCGNFSDCNQIFTSIHDAVPPVITCPGPTTLPCNTVPTPSPTLITATDNCGTPSISLIGTSSSTTDCITTYIFTWRATDACGNFADCDQVLTSIHDLIPPLINCGGHIALPCNTTPTPSPELISYQDNCGIPTITLEGTTSSTVGCLTTTVFRWRATDACGNFAECNQTFTSIFDIIKPVIVCPPPVALPCNTTPSPSVALITATDNCGTPTIALLGTTESTVGCLTTYIFTWRATDACGNFSDCDQVMTSIHDLIPPVITCPDESTLPCNTIPNPSATLISATDNCGVPTITLNHTDAITVDCYTTYIFEWKATDQCGNSSLCEQIINTIADLLPPVIACPSPETLACNTIPVPDASQVIALDNCGGADVLLMGTNSSTLNCLTTYTFYWRAYDECNNFADCEQVFYSVTDHEPPVIVCPPIDTICNAVPTPSVGLISATDNCGPAEITYVGTTTSTAGCITTYNFTWKATDQCGNFSTCVQIIRVINDLLPPVITGCPNSMSVPTELGLCGAHVPWIPPVATDNCGLLSFINDYVPNGFYPVGNTTVTYTATDLCGHVTICQFVITVYDWEPPWNMNCPGVIIQDNDPGLCSAVVTWNVTATDNCGVDDISSVPPSGSVFPVGVTPVTVTATDVNGNTWTCSFNVHVNDNEKPVFANCPGNIVVNNDFRLCTAVVFWNPIHVTDNCELANLTLDFPFAVFPVGVTPVTYTATDIHGNVAKCKFNVTVIDNEPPVINNCPTNIRVDNDPTLCKAEVSWIEPTAHDNCGILSFVSDHNPGDDFPVGITPVTYTATDIHGNITICTFTVRVDDNEDPFILSHDIITCDTVVDFNFIIGDNCRIDEYSYTPRSGSVFHPGTTTLVYVEAWDIHGNFSYKYFNVTVLTPPSKIDTVIASSSEICLGDSVTLTAYFDTLGSGGVIKFYKDFCSQADVLDSANEIDNLWSLKVKPSTTGIVTYYARIEGACDTTECNPVSISVISCPSSVTLNLKIFLEGYYTGGGLMDNSGQGGCLYVIESPGASFTDVDSVNVGAMEATYPYPEVDNQTSVLQTDGRMSVVFEPTVTPGNYYYIRIRHRSSMETWSKDPVLFTAVTSYDFTTASTQAYDLGPLPMKEAEPGVWVIYSGDIDHDGAVTSLDMTLEENDSNIGAFGYNISDLDGDGGSTSLDMTIIESNSNIGVFEAIP